MGLTPTDGVMVPGVGFEPTSPRLQRGAFTRLASQAELNVVRPTGIEPVSALWHRAALPLSYGRPSFLGMVHRAGLEPAKHIGT
jgi:hypothetical protein